MIQITPQMRVLLAVEPADFRSGIDGLARICRAKLDSDPFSGTVFVFRNRRATALKLLVYDGQGYWLCQKRLSSGRFSWWPSKAATKSLSLDVHEIHLLLWNGDPGGAKVAAPWRRVSGDVAPSSPGGAEEKNVAAGLRSNEAAAIVGR